eukprot:5431962-Pyramimonas_sp.AAC.2
MVHAPSSLIPLLFLIPKQTLSFALLTVYLAVAASTHCAQCGVDLASDKTCVAHAAWPATRSGRGRVESE